MTISSNTPTEAALQDEMAGVVAWIQPLESSHNSPA